MEIVYLLYTSFIKSCIHNLYMFFTSLRLSTVNRIEKILNSFDKESPKLKKNLATNSGFFSGVNTLKQI